MANVNLEITGEIVWRKGEFVMPCSNCQDLIVTGGNILCIKITTPKSENITETENIVCDSCKDLIKF